MNKWLLINFPCLNILKFTEEEAGQKVSVEAHLLVFVVSSCTIVCFTTIEDVTSWHHLLKANGVTSGTAMELGTCLL